MQRQMYSLGCHSACTFLKNKRSGNKSSGVHSKKQKTD
uniref:Uncharacterized protein n=1 Tax=Arundo donax TaxID=35708 RepID=A0A0A9C364_ARUDO